MISVTEPKSLEEFAMAPWADPIQAFFEGFEGFVYDPDAAPATQFVELVKEQGWTPGSQEHKNALEQLQNAQFRQFDPSYGNPAKPVGLGTLDKEEELTPAEWAFIQEIKDSLKRDEPAVIQTLDRQLAEVSTGGHIDAFFSEYPEFTRDRTESISAQLHSLRKQKRWWGDRSHLWDQALAKYRGALVQDFNAAYGTDENNLENWHRLFSKILDARLPDTVDECKSAARTLNFNLVDLVEAAAEGHSVILFDSKSALSSYTHQTKKFFPRKHASAGGLLSYLLQPAL